MAASRLMRRLAAIVVIGCALTGAVLPFTPVAPLMGFVPLPLPFFSALIGMVLAYLALVETTKRWFYRRFAI